ncbi:unnamed protein product [Rhizoctonia solani]|uniref:NACHT domain-containing protein n=1 Tax=Rhizoctonia solani TaxID=456999 RepID=A0A8H3GTJ0_9AGAM|nr:unnamed protein product [Rhizoctonia solani]
MTGFASDRESEKELEGQEGINTSSDPRPGEGSHAWNDLLVALKSLRKRAKVIPPLESAIDGLISIIGIFEEAARIKKSHQEFKKLARDLGQTLYLLKEHLQTSKYTRIHDRIMVIARAIEEEVLLFKKQQDSHSAGRFINPAWDEDVLRHYYRIEQLFSRIQIEIGMSAWRVANEHLENTRLETMKPAKLATYNSILSTKINRHPCTGTTRKTTLNLLNQWADHPMDPKVMWMGGMAGTGKTTIAYTLAKNLESRSQLAASFFCTRSDTDCNEAQRIIPTIAYQLARQLTVFQSELCQALDKDPDISFRDPPTQFSQLLQAPLRAIGTRMPNNLVVIIDALDECGDAEVVQSVLEQLFRLPADFPLKFFITSRPELEIIARNICTRTPSGLSVYSALQLHEVERGNVRSDIETYLQNELGSLQPAPSREEIRLLAEMSGQLFIYAVTVVEYIRPHAHLRRMGVNPHQRLATVLKVNSRAQKHFDSIEVLYSTILSVALEGMGLEPNEKECVRTVLWTVVCLREPVHLSTLSVLTGLNDDEETLTALQPLRSVLYVSEQNNFVSTLHKSFSDYMLRSSPGDFKGYSGLLAHRCFDIMKKQLKFNICGLDSSFIPDSDVKDIQKRVDTMIPAPLVYASRYWSDHLSLAGSSDKLLTELNEFLSQRLLFWMEVLNLKRCIGMGVGALLKAQSWLSISGKSHHLISVASHAGKFLAAFAGQAISLSTPHIYISALPFSPVSSWIYRLYRHRMHGLVDVYSNSRNTARAVVRKDMQPSHETSLAVVLPCAPGTTQSATVIHPPPSIMHTGSAPRGRGSLVQFAIPPLPEIMREPSIGYRGVRHASATTSYSSYEQQRVRSHSSYTAVSVQSAPPLQLNEQDDLLSTTIAIRLPVSDPAALRSINHLSPSRRVVEPMQSSLGEAIIEEEPEPGDENQPRSNRNDPYRPDRLANPLVNPYTTSLALDTSTTYSQDTGTNASSNIPWLFRKDGWILNQDQNLLLFVPPQTMGSPRRFELPNPRVFQRLVSRINWDEIFVGNEWTLCYQG